MAINQYCWHGSLHHECDVCAKDHKIKALEQEVERLKGAIAAHNNECDVLCDNDKHCDHRPRQCASCPKDWKVSI